MNITRTDLRAQYDRVNANWAWLRVAEIKQSVPPFLMYALGSRETNLLNVNGDNGHGRGIWQRDDRSFTIPADYLDTPLRQFTDAWALLDSHLLYFSRGDGAQPNSLTCAVAAYNAGRGGVNKVLRAGKAPDTATTGGDYAADVLGRWYTMLGWGIAYV